MDKNAIIAVVLSLAIWMGWQKFYLEPYQKQAQEVAAQQEKARKESLAKSAPVAAVAAGSPSLGLDKTVAKSAPLAEKKTLSVDHGGFSLSASNGPGFLSQWTLRSYYKALEKTEGQVDLVTVAGFSDQLRLRFNDSAYQALNEVSWNSLDNKNGVLASSLNTPQLLAERTLKIPADSQYFADLEYRLKFNGTPPNYVFLELLGSPKRLNDKEGSIWGQTPDKVNFVYRDGEDRHAFMAANMTETHEAMTGIRWFGLDTRYFVLALVPSLEWRKDSGVQIVQGFENGAAATRASLAFPTGGKKEISIPMRVYFGPKELDSLRAADPILTDSIDFGWTSFLAIPILSSLKWLYGYVHNYGLAIIILTALIKMLLYPLTYKSTKAMSKMAKLQPQLNALREKYKDDKEKLNTEMMSFMKTHGYNPVGGCLPILVQMPIFFALYRVLFNSIELYQAPFFFWINDLASPDSFFVTPVLLTGLMFLQQKLTPNTITDPAQQKMMQIMPVMFGVFMLMLPAGLTIYMLVNSVVSIVQQYYLNNKFGVYDNARQAKAAAAAAAAAKA